MIYGTAWAQRHGPVEDPPPSWMIIGAGWSVHLRQPARGPGCAAPVASSVEHVDLVPPVVRRAWVGQATMSWAARLDVGPRFRPVGPASGLVGRRLGPPAPRWAPWRWWSWPTWAARARWSSTTRASASRHAASRPAPIRMVEIRRGERAQRLGPARVRWLGVPPRRTAPRAGSPAAARRSSCIADKPDFVFTVDDADEAAAVLNSLVSKLRARPSSTCRTRTATGCEPRRLEVA